MQAERATNKTWTAAKVSEIVEFVVGSEWNEAFLQNRNYSVIKRTQTIKYEHNFSRRAVEETGEKMRGAMLNPS